MYQIEREISAIELPMCATGINKRVKQLMGRQMANSGCDRNRINKEPLLLMEKLL
jgi:hypothetical protein